MCLNRPATIPLNPWSMKQVSSDKNGGNCCFRATCRHPESPREGCGGWRGCPPTCTHTQTHTGEDRMESRPGRPAGEELLGPQE